MMSFKGLNDSMTPTAPAAAVVSAEKEATDQNPAKEVAVESLQMADRSPVTGTPALPTTELPIENLEMNLNAAREVAVENLGIADWSPVTETSIVPTTEVPIENLEMNLNPAREVVVENLGMTDPGPVTATSALSTTEVPIENPEMNLNPAREIAVKNLGMAMNATTTAVLDRVPNTIDSTAVAEAEEFPRRTLNGFGPFPKKSRSKRPRPENPLTQEEEFLCQCLALLAGSNCSSGSSPRNTSRSVRITSKPESIKNEKKGDFLELQRQTRSYECPICNKSFATYQALGGHKAGHSNKTAENNIHSTFSAPPIGSSLKQNGGAHVCSICHKSFNTGQALGGHKRLHYGRIWNTGGSADNVVSSDDTHREEDTVQTKDFFLHREPSEVIVHNLDLNSEPHPEPSGVNFHNFDLNLEPQPEPASEGEGNSETMLTEVSGNEADDHRPKKRPCFTIKLDLELSSLFN